MIGPIPLRNPRGLPKRIDRTAVTKETSKFNPLDILHPIGVLRMQVIRGLSRPIVCLLCLGSITCNLFVQPASAQTTRPTTRATTRAARGRGPQGPVPGELMDYGSFLSYSVLRGASGGSATTAPAAGE